ncbi:hypothetical protein IFO68_14745 [Photobacterium sp. CAU 1568]|uniref:Integrase catalytic domain-containing protein n=1 Tax=Photobacterium arenosum TaxID=2774143 RepID=A0ABR9BMZ1_9GAMM|nr:hypothetical protein [Photobacterium arenosum]
MESFNGKFRNEHLNQHWFRYNTCPDLAEIGYDSYP